MFLKIKRIIIKNNWFCNTWNKKILEDENIIISYELKLHNYNEKLYTIITMLDIVDTDGNSIALSEDDEADIIVRYLWLYKIYGRRSLQWDI